MEKYFAIFHDISAVGLIAAACAIILTGTVWYSHLLFGKSWRRLSGIRLGDFSKADVKRGYIFGAIVALIQATLIAIIIEHVQDHWGAILGSIGLVWLFLLLELSHRSIWERQPIALFLLHAFRAFAALLACAITYSLMRSL